MALKKTEFHSSTGDLLDNKLKWKILITGYIVFFIALILETAAIFTLNNKINSLYDYVQSNEESYSK